MAYVVRQGKLVRVAKVKRKPAREPISNQYQRELWQAGPVRDMARMIAKQQLMRELRAKGKDPRLAGQAEIENGITVLLFNASSFYLNKAKEALR